VSCADRCRFVKDYVNVLDFIGIALYFVELGLEMRRVFIDVRLDPLLVIGWVDYSFFAE